MYRTAWVFMEVFKILTSFFRSDAKELIKNPAVRLVMFRGMDFRVDTF